MLCYAILYYMTHHVEPASLVREIDQHAVHAHLTEAKPLSPIIMLCLVIY